MSFRRLGWLVVGGVCGWTWARRVLAARDGHPRVTDRQAEILALVARGMSTKEIARQEGISAHSVDTHIRRARRALGVQSRAAAVAALRADGQTPARPRRSATRPSATTISATSSSNGT
ncbi:MAG TPA: helix-turn-helix transcriptional regulator [Candidatus Limnocylindria bacterium]|nr:helix-turn-helix transcriptional regulator [Candidatus Limnocylindria bacterium]